MSIPASLVLTRLNTTLVTAGNVASEVVRTVIVEDGEEPEPDTTAPVITLLGPASLTIQISDEYTDAGATASDDTDGDLTDNITVTGDDFDSNIAGTYTVKYNVSDGHDRVR